MYTFITLFVVYLYLFNGCMICSDVSCLIWCWWYVHSFFWFLSGLSDFLYFKDQTFYFTDFLHYFPILNFINFSCYLYYFLLSSSFLVYWCRKWKYCFEKLLTFLIKTFCVINLPTSTALPTPTFFLFWVVSLELFSLFIWKMQFDRAYI
jgi:hypothetical protein